MLKDILFAGIGYVVGAFTPGVLRVIKTRISAEATKGVSLVDGEIRAAEKDIKAKL